MASPWQKYRLAGEWEGEFSVNNAEHLDEMLEDIYAFLSQSPLGTSDDALDFSEIFTTAGVLYTAAADNALTILPTGTEGAFLRQGTDDPEWSAITLPNALAVGDLWYANTTTSIARLAGVATGNALISGGVNTAPAWGKITLTGHVSGILPIANGGTNNSSFTSGSVIYYDGTRLQEDNSGFYWDAGNNRLGIGVGGTPTETLDIRGATPDIGLRHASASDYASLRFYEGSTQKSIIQHVGSTFGTVGRRDDLELFTLASGGDVVIYPNSIETARFSPTTLTIPSGITLTLAGITATQVLFAGTGGIVSGDSSFVWDSTNNYLGIGITPAGTLDVSGTFSADQAFGFRQQVTHNTATAGTVYGGQFNATITHSSGTMNHAVGLTNAARYGGTGTALATNMSGEQCFIALTGASPQGTITTAQGLNLSQVSNFATGTPAVTISQARGLIIGDIGSGNGSNGLTVSNSSAMSIAGSQTAASGSAVINISNTTSVPFAPSGSWSIYDASTRNSHWAGPFYMGHTTTWGSGTNFISFADGTAPATPPSNTAAIYAEDVNGTVQLFGISESGVNTQLTGVGVRKTADETVTSNTIQADDHLSINLAVGAYFFNIDLHVTTASANAGIQVQLDGTATIESIRADVLIFDHTGNVHLEIAEINAFNTAVGSNSTGDTGVHITGVVNVTAAGTLFLEWAQNTTDGANGTTVQKNSSLTITKLNA